LRKLIIRDSTAAQIIKAESVLKRMTGTIKPAKENPLKVNCEIETFGTKMVRIYKRIALVIKEKNPRVTALRGRENRFKTGLSTILRTARTNPETITVSQPPRIFTPDMAWERMKSEAALKTVFLRIPFTLRD